jgi:hypothetical protein
VISSILDLGISTCLAIRAAGEWESTGTEHSQGKGKGKLETNWKAVNTR